MDNIYKNIILIVTFTMFRKQIKLLLNISMLFVVKNKKKFSLTV